MFSNVIVCLIVIFVLIILLIIALIALYKSHNDIHSADLLIRELIHDKQKLLYMLDTYKREKGELNGFNSLDSIKEN